MILVEMRNKSGHQILCSDKNKYDWCICRRNIKVVTKYSALMVILRVGTALDGSYDRRLQLLLKR